MEIYKLKRDTHLKQSATTGYPKSIIDHKVQKCDFLQTMQAHPQNNIQLNNQDQAKNAGIIINFI